MNNSPDELAARIDALQWLLRVVITSADPKTREILRDGFDQAMQSWHAIGLQTKLSDEYLEAIERERLHWQQRFADADRDAALRRAT